VLKGILGEGQFGKVTHYQNNSYNYAMKVFKTQNTPDYVKEVEALERIQQHPHPCLIHIFLLDDGDVERRFIMEYGVSDLHTAVTEKQPSEERKKAWLGGVFLGLERLHKLKPDPVFHRDMKPTNVIISLEGYAKLVDYGCSRMYAAKAAATWGGPVGTSGYMAPELYDIDSKFAHDGESVDLYALGPLAYCVLTGEDPPGGKGPGGMEHLEQHKQEHAEFRKLIDEQAKDASTWQSLAMGLTEKEPRDRLRHEAIRKHPFMKGLELPEYAEELQGAELARAWLVKHTSK